MTMKRYRILNKYLSVLNRYSQAAMAKRLEPLRIGMGQYMYLFQIIQFPGIGQDKLTGLLGLNKSTVTRAISNLEAEGYLTRVIHQEDKRAYRLYPTHKAQRSLSLIWEMLEEVSGELTAGFTGQERETALVLLERMVRNVRPGVLEEAAEIPAGDTGGANSEDVE